MRQYERGRIEESDLDMARYMTEWEKNVFDVFDVFRI